MRMDSLTGMRFAAAFMIVLYHTNALGGPLGAIRLDEGVSFFFILSGFVLAWSSTALDTKTFYRRRVARIYPIYVLLWFVGVAITSFAGQPQSPLSVVSTLTLTQAWFPSSVVYFGANGVGWSLSVEAFFYVIFPLLVWGILRMSSGQRRLVALSCVALEAMIYVAFGHGMPRDLSFWVSYIFPPARLPEFVLGMVIALEVRDGWRIAWWPGAILLIPAAVWVEATPIGSEPHSIATLIPFALLIAAGASSDLRARGTVFSGRLMVALGTASYALYLLHQLVYRALILPGPIAHDSELLRAPLIIGAITVAIGASYLLCRFVEIPLEQRIRHGGPRVELPGQTRATGT